MPLVQIHMLEGRTKEQKKRMMVEVTEAISRTLGAPKESIRIAIYELPRSHWSVAGVTMEERLMEEMNQEVMIPSVVDLGRREGD